MHEFWEEVWQGERGQILARMRIPGGWMYRWQSSGFNHTVTSIAFVPALPESAVLQCVGDVHCFTAPEKKGRCACRQWLIAVAVKEA